MRMFSTASLFLLYAINSSSSVAPPVTVPQVDHSYTSSTADFPTPCLVPLHCSAQGMRPHFSTIFGSGPEAISTLARELDQYRWPRGTGSRLKEDCLDIVLGLFPSHSMSPLGMSSLVFARVHHMPLTFSSGFAEFAGRARRCGKAFGHGHPLALAFPDPIVPSSQLTSVPETPSEDVLHKDTQDVKDMLADWELAGAYVTAGYLQHMAVPAGGACMWIKLHYGKSYTAQSSCSVANALTRSRHSDSFIRRPPPS